MLITCECGHTFSVEDALGVDANMQDSTQHICKDNKDNLDVCHKNEKWFYVDFYVLCVIMIVMQLHT